MAAIAVVLGTTSCRQILGLDPGVVARDAQVDTETPGDVAPDVMSDAPATMPWTNLAPVSGFAADDQDPTLTADMLELYFSRGTDIYVSTRATVADGWGTPTLAQFAQGGPSDGSPEITPDGLILQFASDRGAVTLDVYYVARVSRAANWSMPQPLSSVNDANFDERPGSATTSGANLTLSSDRNGSGTGLDLYEATRAGGFGSDYYAPVRIPLSTTGEDGSPYLTGDGLTLYYASGPGGGAPRDLFVATRTALTETFTMGVRIEELSTLFNDSDPWVSPDGHHIYFLSNRDGAPRIWHASR